VALLTQSEFARVRRRRRIMGRLFYALCLAAVLISLSMLGVLLFQLGSDGYSRVNWSFLTSFPSRHPEQAGIQAALPHIDDFLPVHNLASLEQLGDLLAAM